MSFFRKFSLFLLPPVFSTMVSLLVLPITTYTLGPQEYGVFALFSSLTGMATMAASAGAGYLMATHFQVIDHEEKKRMLSTITAVGMLILLIFSAAVLLLWPLILRIFPDLRLAGFAALELSLATMLFSFLWIAASDVLTYEGRAGLFASILIGQSILSAIVVTLSLYVFDAGILALFVSACAGSIVVFFGSLIALKSYLRPIFSTEWLRRMGRLSLFAATANFFEHMYIFVERALLSSYAGFKELGLYSHSQQYRTVALMVMKSAGRAVLPATLTEARDFTSTFPQTKKVWDSAYVGIIALGLFFATLGRDAIGLLTHGKFADASILVVAWMIYLLIQNAGKAHTGMLYVHNKGVLYSKLYLGASLIAFGVLFLLVPRFGIWGAFGALFTQMFLFRLFIQIAVRAMRKMPFQDWWILGGILALCATQALSRYFEFNFWENVMLLVATLAFLAFFSRQIFIEFFSKLRQSL